MLKDVKQKCDEETKTVSGFDSQHTGGNVLRLQYWLSDEKSLSIVHHLTTLYLPEVVGTR